jgi:hypothetical protein
LKPNNREILVKPRNKNPLHLFRNNKNYTQLITAFQKTVNPSTQTPKNKNMKKLTLIALFLCGLTFASNATSNLNIVPVIQNIEAKVTDNALTTSTVNNSTSTSDDAAYNAKHKKKKKSFKDRSIAGKVLIIAGVAVFAVLCLLFGTVTIG